MNSPNPAPMRLTPELARAAEDLNREFRRAYVLLLAEQCRLFGEMLRDSQRPRGDQR